MRLLVLIAALAVMQGCDEPTDGQTSSDEAPRPLAQAPEPVQAPAPPGVDLGDDIHAHLHMLARHARTIEARDAAVRGDLLALQRSMSEMAREPLDGVGDLRPEARELATAATSVRAATEIGDAATALGRVAVACGACHTKAGRGPEYPQAYPPDEFPDVRSHMARHQWAADRLWEGLSGPWDAAWNAGADALLEPPLKPTSFGVVEREWTRYGKMAERLHSLAEEARRATTAEQRAGMLGRILVTCGSCHSGLGKGPSTKPRMPQQAPDMPGHLPPPSSP